jgi:hypothetical protein
MTTGDEPDSADVVETAAEAAKSVIFSRVSQSDIRDYDVTVSFEDRQLSVDVYLEAESDTVDEEQIVDDAALAARGAVDELLE